MNKELYEKYKGDIQALLDENCCVVYHVKKEAYLKGLRPPYIKDNLEDIDEEKRNEYILAYAMYDTVLPAFTDWVDDPDDAFKITSIYSFASILNSLFWENLFDGCIFLRIDDQNNVVDFESMLTREMDIEFINKLFDEYYEDW